jgi:hypothetical protein
MRALLGSNSTGDYAGNRNRLAGFLWAVSDL